MLCVCGDVVEEMIAVVVEMLLRRWRGDVVVVKVVVVKAVVERVVVVVEMVVVPK